MRSGWVGWGAGVETRPPLTVRVGVGVGVNSASVMRPGEVRCVAFRRLEVEGEVGFGGTRGRDEES